MFRCSVCFGFYPERLVDYVESPVPGSSRVDTAIQCQECITCERDRLQRWAIKWGLEKEDNDA